MIADRWIQTFSGLRFDPLDPVVSDIRIVDIAHALSNICRYAGHAKMFYSVAEHSCHACDLVHQVAPHWHHLDRSNRIDLRMAALLHDAEEAYIGDIPSPLKAHAGELGRTDSIARAIWKRYIRAKGIDWSDTVKSIDADLLTTERRKLFDVYLPWNHDRGRVLHDARISGWNPKKAKGEFIERWQVLASAGGLPNENAYRASFGLFDRFCLWRLERRLLGMPADVS